MPPDPLRDAGLICEMPRVSGGAPSVLVSRPES
nr:MAG TPA: hypothetical protein [Caudoviricetes sp.]